ncbi:MAG: phage major capsid protein [Mogibacterium sp.]|nr:phage major capsid protein [Mogibacterium sp.]
MRKKILEQRMQRLLDKKQKLSQRCDASTDVNEVRSLTEQLDDVKAEIEETQAELDAIAEEEASQEARGKAPENAQLVGGEVLGAFSTKKEERKENFLESMEYRNAFWKYVQNGTPITRNGEVISTNETGAAIPLTIMREVINTVRKRYGNLYAKVRKTNIKGGVDYPIGALEADFKWITEETVSPRQKTDKLGTVSFKYNTAEIRIAQTFLANLLTLESFEAEITKVIAIAYVKAMDFGIVNGSGKGQMLGILNDERVTNLAGHTIQMSAAEINDWKAWRKNFFAKIPLGYRSGEFMFAASTVDAYLETMSDANGNPIFRQATGLEVNDGDAVNPSGRFFGREVSLTEPDIIADFDTASAGDVVGIFWNPEDYAINENFGFTMRRYFDEDTNEWVEKALVVVDGKVLNPYSFYLITKKAN